MKQLSLNKYLKLTIALTTLVSYVLLLLGGWATQRQDSMNDQIFWNSNRAANGFGVLFVILGWIFWEFFTSSKKTHPYFGLAGIVLTFMGAILINGVLGLIGGCIVIVLITTVFVLIIKKTGISLFKGLIK